MKKKGFTLIELLATIIVLAIIGLIVYPTLNNVIQGNKERLYNKQIDELVRHANTWVVGNSDKLGDKKTYLLTFDEMYKYGLLQSNEVKNPKTNENLTGCMSLVKTENGYSISYSEECKAVIPKKNCTFNGELVQGVEFVDGQYTYTYKKDLLGNFETDGWSIVVTDKNSTNPVTTQMCSTINDKPIISTVGTFFQSQAISIDLSGFDTSNVTNMSYMFSQSQTMSLDLSGFDTNNVTNMSFMFFESQATSLDLSNFNTSNVNDMTYMFCASEATNLDLSSFNTNKVTSMNSMFNGSKAASLNLSNFNTSNVIDMSGMFASTQITNLDLSSFDTSKVVGIAVMFADSQITHIDLSSFDTSNVVEMSEMFENSKATTITFGEKFNTSKVTDMNFMFSHSQVTSLDLSSFDTSSVTNMEGMFQSSQVVSLDLSSFDTSSVTDMRYMFNGAVATTGYAKTQADADKFNNRSVTSIPSTLTFTVK